MSRFAQRPQRRSRTYVIEVDAIDAIDALAQELGVFHSALVNLLLKRALAEVRTGNWHLKARPVAYDVTWANPTSE